MPKPVKKRNTVRTVNDVANALSSEASPKIVTLASKSGLRPTRSPIGPPERAPTRMPMLDHKNAVVKAGPGRFQMWVSDGTAQATALMSYPSQIWISVHSAATRIWSPPIFWFSSAASVADKTVSAIAAASSRAPGSLCGMFTGAVQPSYAGASDGLRCRLRRFLRLRLLGLNDFFRMRPLARPRHGHNGEIGTPVAQQRFAQLVHGRAPQNQIIPPMLFHDLGDHDEDRTAGAVRCNFRHVLQQPPGKAPVRRRSNDQPRRGTAGTLRRAFDILAPLPTQPANMLLGIGTF